MKRCILLLLLVGCGKPETTYQGIDPQLEPYIQELNILSRQHTGRSINVNIPVNFHPIDTSGRCRKLKQNGQESREIFINPRFFRTADHGSMLSTILHEIGHCVYDKPHENQSLTFRNEQIPASVMNSRGISGSQFLENLDYYLNHFHQ